MHLSPTLRPLLRDLLGDEEALISDDMLLQVAGIMSEIRYLSAFLGDDYDCGFAEDFELN